RSEIVSQHTPPWLRQQRRNPRRHHSVAGCVKFPTIEAAVRKCPLFCAACWGAKRTSISSSIVLLSARDRALEALDQCPLRAALRAASRLRFRRPPPLAHPCCRRTSTCDPRHPARSAPIARLLPLP